MQTATRLAAFTAGIAVVGGAAAAIGSATGATPPGGGSAKRTGAPAMAMGGEAMAAVVPGADGTSLSAGGMTLQPASIRIAAHKQTTWRFRIVDSHGQAVRSFERDQTKLLHLIVARTDMTDYQHLHPTLAADGTFSITMRFAEAGRYRAIADFTTASKRYVLGTDLVAPGATTRVPLPAASTSATVDGYSVSLKRPSKLIEGTDAQMTFTVMRDGRPVTGLQPYLGASGHLVALHAPDLAYSHVHPSGKDLARGSITFDTDLHKSGPYRLFLQFRTGGRVHTAAFTQNVDKDNS
jgi:hypothetical protein